MRCSSCAHTWHYTAPVVAPADDPFFGAPEQSATPRDESAPSFLHHPVPKDSFADVLSKTSGGPSFAKPKPPGPQKTPFFHLTRTGVMGYATAAVLGAGLFWMLGSAQFTVTTLLPRAQAAYDAVGKPLVLRASDLVIEGTTLAVTDGKISIKGSIKNIGAAQKAIIPIRAALHGDARPEPLTVWVFRPETKYINPNQTVAFDVTRPFDQSAQVTRVELTFMTDME